jgi:deazaflavin-dependent oxidoreductase (nitroreductase family)
VTSHEAAPPSRHQDRVVAEFRANGGQVGGYHASMQLLLLTTTGARTGQRRAVPLTYLPDGDRYIVTAGNAGSDRHPAWYYNLLASPDVTVEVGSEAFRADAVIADEAERGALYELFAAAYPVADDYQAQTVRPIPVVILTRRPAVSSLLSGFPAGGGGAACSPAPRPMQNSFPSGSANTTHPVPSARRRSSTTTAPRRVARSTCSSRLVDVGQRSKWIRFLAVFPSGTRRNNSPG